jgi:hypothetical protein
VRRVIVASSNVVDRRASATVLGASVVGLSGGVNDGVGIGCPRMQQGLSHASGAGLAGEGGDQART